jgi:hypothetical protein
MFSFLLVEGQEYPFEESFWVWAEPELPWWPVAGSGRSLTPSCYLGHPPSGHRDHGSSPDATP